MNFRFSCVPFLFLCNFTCGLYSVLLNPFQTKIATVPNKTKASVLIHSVTYFFILFLKGKEDC